MVGGISLGLLTFPFSLSFSTDVGAFFEEGMWLRYNFQAPGSGAKESGGRSENSRDPQHGAPDLAREIGRAHV